MTAQEAFSIAFDEAVVMDAAPKNPAAMPGAGDMGGGMGGLGKKPKKEMSIADHMRIYHPHGFDPKKDKCKLFDRMVKNLESQGIDKDTAMNRALQAHNFGAQSNTQGQNQSTQENYSPEQLNDMVNQMVADPSLTLTTQSAPLAEPETINTPVGDINVETTVQKAIVTILAKEASDDNDIAKDKLQDIVDYQGMIKDYEYKEENPLTISPSDAETFTSEDGSFSISPNAVAAAIINADEDGMHMKKELFQDRVNLEAQLKNAQTEEEEKDIRASIDVINRLFNGGDGADPLSSGNEEQISETGEAINNTESHPENGGDIQHQTSGEQEEQIGQATEQSQNQSEQTQGGETESESIQQNAPSDENFKTGDRTYKVGNVVYRDVSGQGFWRSLFSTFAAGLRGEDIITGWDRISGTWDGIKRSASGENVRDGIAGALIANTINDYMGRDSLSDDARMELTGIRDMLNEAKTASKRMSVIDKLQKWKDKYSSELSDTMETIDGDFSNLGQKNPEWKSPPTSIFPPVPADERDTSFMETKGNQILDALDRANIDVDILERINGSSVVQFKVQRKKPGTDKALQDALKNMQSDLGITISYTPDTTSGALRTGTITINNPKVKDASLQRLLEDRNGIEAAKKMDAPLLVGETADGKAVWCDAGEHGFLGGDSGGGKSERIIGMVSGAFSVKSPSELQVILNAHANAADFEDFEEDPHTASIGHNIEEVAENLMKANSEWKRRQRLFASMGIRNLKDYNKKMEEEGTPEKKLPQLLIITDEVTNLLSDKPELAKQIRDIVTNGRKFGVCHIGATQDMNAKNMPTDIKGALRMGVKATKSQAAKAIFDVHTDELGKMNPKGDIMYRDKSGNLVRLRGTYADKETRSRLLDYNTGKISAPDVPESESHKPEDIKNGDGKPESLDSGEEQNGGNTDGSEEDDDIYNPESTIEEAIGKLEKIRDKAKEEAREAFRKSKRTGSDKTKLKKALEKAESDFNEEMETVSMMYDSQNGIGGERDYDGTNLEMPEEGDGGSSGSGTQGDSDDSPAKIMERAKKRTDREREKIKKARDEGRLTERKARQQLTELDKRYKDAETVFNSNGTAEAILDVLEPEEKNEEQSSVKGQEQEESLPTGQSEDDIQQEERQRQEDAARNAKAKASVKPTKFYGGKSVFGSQEAVEKLTEKEQKKIKETLLPDGWDFVTENGFNAPARTEKGWIYVQNPENGSHGHIYKDPNTGNLRLWKEVDTTHPDYKGYVQNENGEWELSPEAKKIEAETKHIRKYSKNEAEREEAQRKLNNARYGRDEAPDNRAIIANAIAEALSRIDKVN